MKKQISALGLLVAMGTANLLGGESMELTSTAFENGGAIPVRYTCDGVDMSPPLSIGAIPPGTKSLALVCDDPDAPGRTFVHWVVYNLPPGTSSLPEGISAKERIPAGGVQGRSDFGRLGYGGPCPPSGTHRYFFKLYALDTALGLNPGASKKELQEAMEGHILGEAVLMGTYKRK